MKRSPLRRVSKKTAAENRKIAPLRNAYKAEFELCMLCNKKLSTDVHEIARGTYRAQAKLKPSCWLTLCRGCHSAMDDYSTWPITRQLALKLIVDPGRFDLAEVNEVRGRAIDAISLAEVVQHLDLKE